MENGKDERASVGRGNGLGRDPLLPTLRELGIGKWLADRARKLSKMTDKEFGLYIVDGRPEAIIRTTVDGGASHRGGLGHRVAPVSMAFFDFETSGRAGGVGPMSALGQKRTSRSVG